MTSLKRQQNRKLFPMGKGRSCSRSSLLEVRKSNPFFSVHQPNDRVPAVTRTKSKTPEKNVDHKEQLFLVKGTKHKLTERIWVKRTLGRQRLVKPVILYTILELLMMSPSIELATTCTSMVFVSRFVSKSSSHCSAFPLRRSSIATKTSKLPCIRSGARVR
jgi:hypothetical protein